MTTVSFVKKMHKTLLFLMMTSFTLAAQDTRSLNLYIDSIRLSYKRSGSGDKIFFLHGNPTSSFIWRNISPIMATDFTCIAPDMAGMGNSAKVDSSVKERYTYKFHYELIEKLIFKLVGENEKIYIAGHDWGGVIAINWARRHPDKTAGIIFMETFVEPLETGKTPSFSISWFKKWATDEGRRAILDSNKFVEKVLLSGDAVNISEDDKNEYRKPFTNKGEDRLPVLYWPLQVPVDGEPSYTYDVLVTNLEFMQQTPIPKLFIEADPGALIISPVQKDLIRSFPDLTTGKVKGRHFIQEQSPVEIAEQIKEWLLKLKEK